MLSGGSGRCTHEVLGEINESEKEFSSPQEKEILHQLEVARKVRVLHQQAPQQLQGART